MSSLINKLFLFCCCSFLFCFVISIDGINFDEQDFYSKYSKSEWVKASSNQKNRILKDYVKRESAALDALGRGFLFDPVIKNNLSNIERQLLVNFVYDYSVAFPLIDNKTKSLSFKNLSKDVFIKHLLVSHSASVLSNPPERSKDEALVFISSLRDSISSKSAGFEELSISCSDDPSAPRNGGVLGWLQWGVTPMPFQSSVWSLGVDSLSNIIETEYGYHLVVVDSVRSSEFAEYDDDSFEYSALKSSLVSVRDLLKEASFAYDRETLEGRVVFFENQIDSLVDLVLFEKESLSSLGQTFNLYSFLNSLDSRFVLCSVDNKKFGVRWLLSSLSQIPNSRIPEFADSSSFIDFIKIILMQKIAISDGYELEINKKPVYKKRVAVETSKLLYDSLLKKIVNSVGPPDSLRVLNYYNKHREEKYFNPERVVVRQIKVNTKTLADSLKSELTKNPNLFIDFASNFSINRADVGGLMDPFEAGKYNYMGEAAFSLAAGDISSPIENPDKTFSIILLEEKINKSFLPIERVYKRIESLLIKQDQEYIKKSTFENYLNSSGLEIGIKYEKFID